MAQEKVEHHCINRYSS